MCEELITTKLLNEALNCPIAFTELVRQYGQLDSTQRLDWAESLTGAQASSLYYAAQMHTSDELGMLMLILAGIDTTAGDQLVRAMMRRVGQAFDFEVVEGATIPAIVRDSAMEYALSLAE